MEILTKSISVIDYESNEVFSRETPTEFDEYVKELIGYINDNDAVRLFKTTSVESEVISCALKICENKTDKKFVEEKTQLVSQRLLREEVETQRRIEHMNSNVQKGSLIQALLYDENNRLYSYLLAKVEHTDFVDDYDFTFKTGFSKNKKTVWKTCIISMPRLDAVEYHAKIYSNTVAKYWSHNFLELEPIIDDEHNTIRAFEAIDTVLSRNIRSSAPKDYRIIRNSMIAYFKTNNHFDYDVMLETILGDYRTTDLAEDKMSTLKEKLKELPRTKKFDKQFTPIANAINARIRQVYTVNEGIELRITDKIDDLENTITAFEDEFGFKYIKIRTNNNHVFEQFKA